jgi:O-antigen ligase
MMRFLLFLIICVLAFVDIFGTGLTIGAGISARNLLLYLGAGWLLLEHALGRPFKGELKSIQICLMVLITYAIITVFIAGEIIHYQGYEPYASAISLKVSLVDSLMFFLVFFYGARTVVGARSLLKVLLIAVSIASLFTIARARGIIAFGVPVMDSDRVDGVFGDANETGTMIASLLPVYVPVILSAKKFGKIFWVVCMILPVVVMLMGVSRGALVGLLFGTLWAAYLCRRYLSFRVAIKWGSTIFAITTIAVLIAGRTYLEIYIHRWTGVSMSSASDVSSGRSDVWGQAFFVMMNSPVSLITGFGWGTWWVMGFYLAAHNHYLLLWFELGLVGVVSFLLILRQLVKTALTTAAVADTSDRNFIVAFVFSFLILAVGIFFVLLFKPWTYLWAYIGLAMRYTVNVRAESRVNLDLQTERNLPQVIGRLTAPARSAQAK